MATSCTNPDCGTSVPLHLERCPTCGEAAGFPNVKLARAERAALAQRAADARADALARRVQARLTELEALLTGAVPVINVDPPYLYSLLSWDKALYAGYQDQVAGHTRLPASFEDDANRVAVEGKLFGSAGRAITYAALSPDGGGLVSYGGIALTLKLSAIQRRVSLLTENSYDFYSRHPVGLGPLPRGHRSDWEGRGDLGVAKLAASIQPSTAHAALPGLILFSNGDRRQDSFIEAHIWGQFDRNAIASVRVQRPPTDPHHQHLLDAARDKARLLGIPWT